MSDGRTGLIFNTENMLSVIELVRSHLGYRLSHSLPWLSDMSRSLHTHTHCSLLAWCSELFTPTCHSQRPRAGFYLGKTPRFYPGKPGKNTWFCPGKTWEKYLFPVKVKVTSLKNMIFFTRKKFIPPQLLDLWSRSSVW